MSTGGGGGGGVSISGSGTALTPSYENYASDSAVCIVFINSASGVGADRSVANQAALSSMYPTGVLTLGGQKDLLNETATVTSSVKNTGSAAGAEVAQLYVSYPAAAQQPPKQLRGFENVSLQPGQEKVFELLGCRSAEWAIAGVRMEPMLERLRGFWKSEGL